MSDSQFRTIITMFEVCSLEEAVLNASEIYKQCLDNFHIIDTTCDFNQNKWLGQELANTLIYSSPQTRINALLSIAGCVRAGNTLIFAFERGNYGKFYREFFFPKLEKISNQTESISSKKNSIESIAESTALASEKNELSKQGSADSTDSAKAIVNKSNSDYLKLRQLLQGNNVVHLIGERGTGKSTLLGELIKNILHNKKTYPHVVLISPSKKSSKNTLQKLENVSRETFLYGQANTVSDNQLARASHIIVDEAASLSQAFIEKVRKQARGKVIFSTTIDGYESTGQSYRLTHLVHGEEAILHLIEPKRYSFDDPLHAITQQLCHPRILQNQDIKVDDGIYNICDLAVSYEKVMLSAFALLQQAHYKTTPNDLVNLYDTDGELLLAVKEKNIIGALYALPEALERDNQHLFREIFYGRRRIKNAMTQQQLINAYGEQGVASKKIMRISRIAVEKSHRRQKIGELLIKYIEERAKNDNCDYLSTSFSYKADTFAFWLAQGFIPVRIGVSKNKWHNSFSVLMMKVVADSAPDALIASLNKRFCHHLSFFSKTYSEFPELTQKYALTKTDESSEEGLLCGLGTSKIDINTELTSIVDNHRDINWALPSICSSADNREATLIKALRLYQHGKLLDKSEKKILLHLLKENLDKFI